MTNSSPGYAELQAVSCFSFLRGASHPEELVARAAQMGLAAIGICEYQSLAGAVRAHMAGKAHGLRVLVGARLTIADYSLDVLCYPTDRSAYGRLSALLSASGMRGRHSQKHMELRDVLAHDEGQIFIALAPEGASIADALSVMAGHWRGRLYLAAGDRYRADYRGRIARLEAVAGRLQIPLVATGDVLYHDRVRRPLHDVMTCIREHSTLAMAGFRLEASGDRALKSPAHMARRFAGAEAALARSLDIVRRCRFSLDELRYDYPHEPVPAGMCAQDHLRDLAWAGAQQRYGGDVPAKVGVLIDKELALIASLGYARYFLTVHDIVAWARSQGILCQGRGSAANSAICFCLGITSVDPDHSNLLFERFLSRERKQPPDIDVDFEHDRREEVIQYMYRRYGRERAALTATVICYRWRSATRDVCKVFGLSDDVAAALAGTVWGRDDKTLTPERLRKAGIDPANPLIRRACCLIRDLVGFPRHLSQHVGGFVLTEEKLTRIVPIGRAAMDARTCIEWDKDDIDALGIMKVDILGLGMLSCIRKSFDLIARHKGQSYDLASVPSSDEAVYDMLSAGDSLGVFQVESRAQMSMLPRLRPRCFYDLVIEVAIVRPGPIQGDMVHPYLRRREGLEEVVFPSPAPEHGASDELHAILGRTLGVPLFQEQAMQIAIDAARFSGDEANGLRRAMATFRKAGTIHDYEHKFVDGMVRRGYDKAFAQRCFNQIRGFGEYGFPESHAASFALLVYVSSWLKCHHPEVFTAALLNSQPMGFYAPAQLVRDARAHGVVVRPVDVNASCWECTLEPRHDGPPALRLGFRQVDGLRAEEMETLCAQRGDGYSCPGDMRRRAGLGRKTLALLAAADAFTSMGLDRREALWHVHGQGRSAAAPLFAAIPEQANEPHPVRLPVMPLPVHVGEDYRMTRLSLKAHPMRFLRSLHGGLISARAACARPDGAHVRIAGLVLTRQRPGTSKGVVFVTLEDESGVANLVIWPHVLERFRPAVMNARVLLIDGRVQKTGAVVHIVASRLLCCTADLSLLSEGDPVSDKSSRRHRHPRTLRLLPRSRDFH